MPPSNTQRKTKNHKPLHLFVVVLPIFQMLPNFDEDLERKNKIKMVEVKAVLLSCLGKKRNPKTLFHVGPIQLVC